MSDKIFLPDTIPSGYIYGNITGDYVELYNKPSFQNETATFYRIYYNYSSGLVVSGTRTFGVYSPTTYEVLPISRDVMDRPDYFNILFVTLAFTLCGLWLFNLMTSLVRKGGVFGGLF